MSTDKPLVGIIMGSKSDWDAMKAAGEMLTKFGVPHESRVMSAHRTPGVVAEYVSGAIARGMEVIIAGAVGSEKQRLAVGKRDVAAVCAVLAVFRLITVDDNLRAGLQRFLREASAQQRVRRPRLDHPLLDRPIVFLDVDVDPRVWVDPE